MEQRTKSDGDVGLTTSHIYNNSLKEYAPWFSTTGFRTAQLRYNAMAEPSAVRVAEDYLLNSRYRRGDRESEASARHYFQDTSLIMLSRLGEGERSGLERIELPDGVRLTMGLGSALKHRRSCRDFTGDALPFDYLASLLRSGNGINGNGTVDLMAGGERVLNFRTTPSGGGLYPVDLVVAALNVERLDRRLYAYDPLHDSIDRLDSGSGVEAVLSSLIVPEGSLGIDEASAIIIMVGRPWRSMRKYGNRGLRFLFLEAGGIAQSIHLAAVSLGLGSVPFAGYIDDELHRALEIDGLYETVVHVIIVGAA